MQIQKSLETEIYYWKKYGESLFHETEIYQKSGKSRIVSFFIVTLSLEIQRIFDLLTRVVQWKRCPNEYVCTILAKFKFPHKIEEFFKKPHKVCKGITFGSFRRLFNFFVAKKICFVSNFYRVFFMSWRTHMPKEFVFILSGSPSIKC